MADDKVRELAEWTVDAAYEEPSVSAAYQRVEKRVRAELKPLLDAAQEMLSVLKEHAEYEDKHANISIRVCGCSISRGRLAAELKQWRKE